MSASVQFRDPESILTAYEKRGVPAFAIFSGKELFLKWDMKDLTGEDPTEEQIMEQGKDQLEGVLNLLIESGSAGIYSLRVYEEVPAKGIKSNTPHDGAFGFRFFSQVNDLPGPIRNEYGNGNSWAMYKELKQLRNELNELKAQEETETANEGEAVGSAPAPGFDWAQVLGQILMPLIPRVAEALGNGVVGLINGKPAQAQKISGITFDEEQAIKGALETMRKNMPAGYTLGQVLQKLASISENSNTTFAFYVNTLMNMK